MFQPIFLHDTPLFGLYPIQAVVESNKDFILYKIKSFCQERNKKLNQKEEIITESDSHWMLFIDITTVLSLL